MRPSERKARVEKIDSLLARRDAKEALLGLQLNIDSHAPLEIANYLDLFDFYIFNMEHSLASSSDLRNMAAPLDRTGRPWFVKLNATEPLLIRDAQDCGAYGVLMPFIGSAEELVEVMEICKFPNRGICPMARLLGQGAIEIPDIRPRRRLNLEWLSPEDFTEFVNNEFLFIPVLESADAVENVDEIMAVEGVRLVSFGWADLNSAMKGEGFSGEEIAKVQRVLVEKARQAGKVTLQPVPGMMGAPRREYRPVEEQVFFDRQKLRKELEYYGAELLYTDDGSVLAWGIGLIAELIYGERKLLG